MYSIKRPEKFLVASNTEIDQAIIESLRESSISEIHTLYINELDKGPIYIYNS